MVAGISGWHHVSQARIRSSKSCLGETSADDRRKYLADPSVDVRLSTENLLGEFLREIKYIANVQEKQAEMERRKQEQRQSSKHAKETSKSTAEEGETAVETDEEQDEGTNEEDWEGEGSGAWVPGQGVRVDHSAIMDIVIQHLSYPGEPSSFAAIAKSSLLTVCRRIGADDGDGLDLELFGSRSEHRHWLHSADSPRHPAESRLSQVSYVVVCTAGTTS